MYLEDGRQTVFIPSNRLSESRAAAYRSWFDQKTPTVNDTSCVLARDRLNQFQWSARSNLIKFLPVVAMNSICFLDGPRTSGSRGQRNSFPRYRAESSVVSVSNLSFKLRLLNGYFIQENKRGVRIRIWNMFPCFREYLVLARKRAYWSNWRNAGTISTVTIQIVRELSFQEYLSEYLSRICILWYMHKLSLYFIKNKMGKFCRIKKFGGKLIFLPTMRNNCGNDVSCFCYRTAEIRKTRRGKRWILSRCRSTCI